MQYSTEWCKTITMIPHNLADTAGEQFLNDEGCCPITACRRLVDGRPFGGDICPARDEPDVRAIQIRGRTARTAATPWVGLQRSDDVGMSCGREA